MLDFVTVAMVAIVIVLVISIALVKRGKYRLHKRIQLVMAVVLVAAVLAFEIDVRFFTDWRVLAEPSPLYESGWVTGLLYFHLMFAIPTPFVWGFVIWRAIKRFENPPVPGTYSSQHKKWAWIATLLMVMTAATGWAFYITAFVI